MKMEPPKEEHPRAKSAYPQAPITNLTPEQLYNLSHRIEEWGIEGYEVPRHYYCYHQVMWEKQREKILNSHKHIWPPLDWPKKSEDDDSKVPPKRPNYLDDLYKWCNSYYDKKRAEELISEKNINTKDYVKPLFIDKRKRKDFLENEKKKEEWRKTLPKYPEYKTEAIEQATEHAKEDAKLKEITYEQKMKAKYKIRPQTARCDRVTIVADAEFVGEQIPFYNTAPQERELKKKLFYPDKTPTWRRAPAWKYPKATPPSQNIKDRDDAIEEKVEEYLSNKGIKRSDLNLDIPGSFYKVKHHGEIYYKMVKKFNYDKEEQYQNYIENNPKKYVGPQHYWRMPKETFNKRGKKNKSAALGFIEDDKGNKVFYMDRKKTDKRVFTAGMRKAVY